MIIPQDMIVGTIHETKFNGKVEILSYGNKSSVTIRFLNTGNEKTVSSKLIRSKTIKDELKREVYGVGFFGIGGYKSKSNGKHTMQYSTWRSMIRRCHCEIYLKANPTYIGCSVFSEWHNFQIFSEWFDKNYPTDGGVYELDKDIRVDGNKIYSPEFCTFVSRRENTVKAKALRYKFKDPRGGCVDVYNLSEFCRENTLDVNCMCQVNLGRASNHAGWTKG